MYTYRKGSPCLYIHTTRLVTLVIALQGLMGFTGRSYEQLRKDLTRDLYLTAPEAVEYGLIDKVCDDMTGLLVHACVFAVYLW